MEEERKNQKIKDLSESLKELTQELIKFNNISKLSTYPIIEENDSYKDNKDLIPSEVLETWIDEKEIIKDNLTELFDFCLKQKPIHLGLARHLLRQAGNLRTNVLHERVLDNLENLLPVMRDVCLYLIKTTQNKTAYSVGNALINFYKNSNFSFLPYLNYWISSTLTRKFTKEFAEDITTICESAPKTLGNRPFALLAKELGHLDWAREQKETWQNNSPWEKRAIIWAVSSLLPTDECIHWIKRVQNAGDLLDKAIAEGALHLKYNPDTKK